jgi:uroporphyrinogen decarboxylase
MTSKERFLSAVDHREPDRVPLCMDAEAEVWEALKPALNVKSKEEVYKTLKIDEWMVDPNVEDPRAKTIGPKETVSQWGYHIKRIPSGVAEYGIICGHPLANAKTVQDIDNYDWPDPALVRFDHWAAKMEEMKDMACIGHVTHGPYFNCTFVRGMEQYMMDMAMEPEFAKRMMDRAEEYIQACIDKMLVEAAGALDVYYIADDFCQAGGPLFSPAVWRDWVKPYLKRMADKVHQKGVKFMIHVCGSVREYLPDLIEAGVDILEPVQTTAKGMALEGLKKDFGKDITFYGSMDTHKLLPKGSPKDVADAVKRTLDIMAPGGGFVLGPAHTYIQPDTPAENIIAMYRTACEYGKY